MTWNRSIRQGHRWVSIIFTVAVIGNIAAMSLGSGEPPAWLTYAPLLPLALLLLSGLYLFVLPYLRKGRDQQASGGMARTSELAQQ